MMFVKRQTLRKRLLLKILTKSKVWNMAKTQKSKNRRCISMTMKWQKICLQIVTAKLKMQEFSINSYIISSKRKKILFRRKQQRSFKFARKMMPCLGTQNSQLTINLCIKTQLILQTMLMTCLWSNGEDLMKQHLMKL